MNKLKEFLTYISENKKQVITLLVIGITVLSIPVGLQLSQKQQTLKSQAAEAGAMWRTNKGNKTFAQMKAELLAANPAFGDVGLNTWSQEKVFRIYMQAGAENNSISCVANVGDFNNMPTTLLPFVVNQGVVVSVMQKPNNWNNHFCDYPRISVFDASGGGNTGPIVCEAGVFDAPGDNDSGMTRHCIFTPTRTGSYRMGVYYGGHSDDGCKDDAKYAFCNFEVVASSGGGGGGGGGGTTSGTPVTGGTVTCDANNRATFNWTAASATGKTVQSYVLRINKSPADWAPEVSGSDTTTVSQGDRAVWPISGTSVSVNLSSGSYLDFSVQTDFSDGTNLRSANFSAFNCPGGGGSPTGCSCASDSCLPGCNFTKLTGVTYPNPTQCKLASNIPTTVPTAENKNAWCSRAKRTLGDADGNNTIDTLDYAYYLRVALGAKIPPTVNPDFSGDGEVGQADLSIWSQGRGQ